MKTTQNTILITGGTSGIGLATAKQFIQQGNTVLVTGRTQSKVDAFNNSYPQAKAVVCNFQQQKDITALVQLVAQNYPQLNVLINNAGIQYNYFINNETNAAALAESEVLINLTSQLQLTLRLLPILQRNENAAILNTTSALAITPKSDAIVYCATKAALHSFTKGLRYQLEDTNVKVLEIMPPLVDTAMTAGRGTGKISPEAMAQLIVKGLEKEKELITTSKIKFLVLLNRIAPKLAAKILK